MLGYVMLGNISRFFFAPFCGPSVPLGCCARGQLPPLPSRYTPMALDELVQLDQRVNDTTVRQRRTRLHVCVKAKSHTSNTNANNISIRLSFWTFCSTVH